MRTLTLNQYTEVDPGAPATPTYDEDGNMLSDGSGKRLVWDGEPSREGSGAEHWLKASPKGDTAAGCCGSQNRLIEVRDGKNNALMATYTYDGQSRRVRKVTTSIAPQGASEEVYLYDGWNRIATYSVQPSSFNLHTSLTCGRDLSGTLEGAGGVGGLLATRDAQLATTFLLTYDANGNVSELIDGSGAVAAHYEYDTFGNVVVASGTYASTNPWRFSTKPVDPETLYSYYGFRYYNPETGRWLSRDPIEEEGGVNLYGFVANGPVNRVDPLGLFTDVDGDVLSHALDTINSGSSGGLPFMNFFRQGPSLTIDSKRVDFASTDVASKIRKIASDYKAELCSCKSVKIDEQIPAVQTKHLWSLGRTNVQANGSLDPQSRPGVYRFNGTLEPLGETFDFNYDPSRGAAASFVTMVGSAAQTALGILSFQINFTGPVKFTMNGAVSCP